MSNEISVRNSITIRSGGLIYLSNQRSYRADMSGSFGPAPAAFLATYDGTDVDLSGFTDPGWCHIINNEASGGVTVSWGIYDPETDRYYPLGKLEPGQDTGLFQLDDLFRGEFVGTGTGTDLGINRLRVKAKDGDSASVFVGVFER